MENRAICYSASVKEAKRSFSKYLELVSEPANFQIRLTIL